MDVADEIERKEGRPLPAPGGDGRAGRVAQFDVDERGEDGGWYGRAGNGSGRTERIERVQKQSSQPLSA